MKIGVPDSLASPCQCVDVRHPPAGITFKKATADEREVYHRTGFISNEGWLLPVLEQSEIQH